MPRRSRLARVVIRNMMMAERNDAEMMPAEQQRAAIELAFAPAQEIDAGDGRRGAEKRGQRRHQRQAWAATSSARIAPSAAPLETPST